ncbi:beta-galactosidase BglB [Actibacterium lipolyticum]|uniref:Unsaturated rhamnogalacturonyl hydrolase YesR n=1 Tax=Actibacterium lipolyticum TaxID=1524263 RepID=A0A238L8H2_9RHOB|nr:glycoside hydrolase family 88 protein [Actibacterium lipolyticum]SMX51111.1 Unsaturated rhamnogalacturonyl hydrolase YesR [Actibacterium lipolyticum]
MNTASPKMPFPMHAVLDQLVTGLTHLSDEGRFDEPNLDGTAGDYISFDSWEWPQGVGLFGIAQLWEARDYSDDLGTLLKEWYANAIAKGLPPQNVNTTAPMLALALYWDKTRDPAHGRVLDDWANKLMATGARTAFDGFQHDVSDKLNDGEIWDDTLYMVALFLAAYGQASGRRELVDEAEKQFLLHTQFLADRETGLWFHGWTFNGRHNFANARWARGNAWITAGIVDLFALAEVSGSVRGFLAEVLKDQVNALLPLQDKSGMWHTLLDEPDSYLETSATAGIAYGLLKAARLGIGPSSWKDAGLRALNAVVASVDENGVVQGVSYGTRMGHDLQHYRDISIEPTAYGQSLAILALVEGCRAFETEGQPQ